MDNFLDISGKKYQDAEKRPDTLRPPFRVGAFSRIRLPAATRARLSYPTRRV
jgi:hypothetical protein